MARLRQRWTAFIDGQHRYPTGLAGRAIGERMVRQHAPETAWTIDLLDIRPADRVLELGFGAGRGLAAAAQLASRGLVVGLDLSAAMARSAARRNRAAIRAGRVALLRGSIERLPLAGRFDKIFSIHTLYFWPNPLPLCASLAGMLRPGGTLAVTLASAAQRGPVMPAGTWEFWPIHAQVEALVGALAGRGLDAALLRGPDSRQFNNIALVVRA